MRDSALVR